MNQHVGTKDITSLNENTSDLHGYSADCLLNLKSNIGKKEKALGEWTLAPIMLQPCMARAHAFVLLAVMRPRVVCAGSTHDFQHFELGRSDVRVGGRHIAVGTDNPESVQHFLSIIDGDIMRKSARDDPVLCYTRVPEHLSDVRWLNADTLLAATGKGNLKLFHFDQSAETVKHIGKRTTSCGIEHVSVVLNPSPDADVSAVCCVDNVQGT
jgi:hypothetical protein